MSASDYAENLLLNFLLNSESAPRPSGHYLALHNADPGETGTSEMHAPTHGAYARISVAFTAAAGGIVSNNASISFMAASNTWGVVTHYSVWDALSGGNCLAIGALASPLTVTAGVAPSFMQGALVVQLQ